MLRDNLCKQKCSTALANGGWPEAHRREPHSAGRPLGERNHLSLRCDISCCWVAHCANQWPLGPTRGFGWANDYYYDQRRNFRSYTEGKKCGTRAQSIEGTLRCLFVLPRIAIHRRQDPNSVVLQNIHPDGIHATPNLAQVVGPTGGGREDRGGGV